jgi:NAD(P)H-dependent FMN reductase
MTIYESLADLPHFSPDLDGENSPAPVSYLREQLRAADGVLICTPEYAYGIPGSLKNALDWTVSSGEFAFKPVAVVSSSPFHTGGEKAQASLILTLTAEAAKIVEGGTLAIPLVRAKMNGDGKISDAETRQALRAVLDALAREIG